MYHCIFVQPEDGRFQSILWRESPNLSIKRHELNTVTYRITFASFLETKCLKILAEEVAIP